MGVQTSLKTLDQLKVEAVVFAGIFVGIAVHAIPVRLENITDLFVTFTKVSIHENINGKKTSS